MHIQCLLRGAKFEVGMWQQNIYAKIKKIKNFLQNKENHVAQFCIKSCNVWKEPKRQAQKCGRQS
jgi:hypothetical protein